MNGLHGNGTAVTIAKDGHIATKKLNNILYPYRIQRSSIFVEPADIEQVLHGIITIPPLVSIIIDYLDWTRFHRRRNLIDPTISIKKENVQFDFRKLKVIEKEVKFDFRIFKTPTSSALILFRFHAGSDNNSC